LTDTERQTIITKTTHYRSLTYSTTWIESADDHFCLC